MKRIIIFLFAIFFTNIAQSQKINVLTLNPHARKQPNPQRNFVCVNPNLNLRETHNTLDIIEIYASTKRNDVIQLYDILKKEGVKNGANAYKMLKAETRNDSAIIAIVTYSMNSNLLRQNNDLFERGVTYIFDCLGDLTTSNNIINIDGRQTRIPLSRYMGNVGVSSFKSNENKYNIQQNNLNKDVDAVAGDINCYMIYDMMLQNTTTGDIGYSREVQNIGREKGLFLLFFIQNAVVYDLGNKIDFLRTTPRQKLAKPTAPQSDKNSKKKKNKKKKKKKSDDDFDE